MLCYAVKKFSSCTTCSQTSRFPSCHPIYFCCHSESLERIIIDVNDLLVIKNIYIIYIVLWKSALALSLQLCDYKTAVSLFLCIHAVVTMGKTARNSFISSIYNPTHPLPFHLLHTGCSSSFSVAQWFSTCGPLSLWVHITDIHISCVPATWLPG